jgi:hypothetical protein
VKTLVGKPPVAPGATEIDILNTIQEWYLSNCDGDLGASVRG